MSLLNQAGGVESGKVGLPNCGVDVTSDGEVWNDGRGILDLAWLCLPSLEEGVVFVVFCEGKEITVFVCVLWR